MTLLVVMMLRRQVREIAPEQAILLREQGRTRQRRPLGRWRIERAERGRIQEQASSVGIVLLTAVCCRFVRVWMREMRRGGRQGRVHGMEEVGRFGLGDGGPQCDQDCPQCRQLLEAAVLQ